MSAPSYLAVVAVVALPWIAGCGPADSYPLARVLGTEVEWTPDGLGHIQVEGEIDMELDILDGDGEEAEVRLLSVLVSDGWGSVVEMAEGRSEPPTPFIHVAGRPSAFTVHFAGPLDTSSILCAAWIEVVLWDSYTDQFSTATARLADGSISPACGP